MVFCASRGRSHRRTCRALLGGRSTCTVSRSARLWGAELLRSACLLRAPAIVVLLRAVVLLRPWLLSAGGFVRAPRATFLCSAARLLCAKLALHWLLRCPLPLSIGQERLSTSVRIISRRPARRGGAADLRVW